MRKTSQDGGEYSATSAVENEVKKSKGLLSELKIKKIGKRTAPNLSEESDDAVVEPLLQKSTNSAVQSAKYFAKAKADTVKEITKLFNDKKTQHASTSGFGTTETLLSEKDQADSKTNVSNVPLHNHMNTNVFHSLDNTKVNGTTKTQVLVEIDGSKQSGLNPSPLIFTTARIHTDGKPNHMEPVQMTPAPILSTVEVSVSKGNVILNEKKINNGTSIMNVSLSQPLKAENTPNFSTTVKAQNSISKSDNLNKPLSTNITKENKMTTATNKPDKTQLNYPLKYDSLSFSSKLISAANVNLPVATNSKDTTTIFSKPSISENTKSDVQTTKSPLEENKAVESSPQLPYVSQTHKKEKPNTIDSDSKSINKEKVDKSSIAINIKTNVIETPTSSSTKPLEWQEKITAAEELIKLETKMDSPKNSECERVKDSSAKSSSSANIPTQSKINENKLTTDTDVSLKSSGNEKSKLNSKVSVINPATAYQELLISSPIVKPDHDPLLLPAIDSSTITDSSKKTSLNNPKADITDLNVAKTHVLTPKTTTLVTDTINSNANKTQAKTTKTASSTTDTAISNTDKTKAPTSMAEKAVSKDNKTQSITATSITDTGSSNTNTTKPIITKGQISMADKASPTAEKTQSLPIKAPTSISDKPSSNAYKTQAVTATSIANKPSSKANKTQTLPTKASTSISDKTSTNAKKTQAVTATTGADKANAKADKIQTLPTKAQITDKNKTQAAISIADKTGSNTSKSQPVTTKAATSTGHLTSSKVNKTMSTKTATSTNTKPTTATSTKTATNPISVSTVSKNSTNKPPSTTSSAKIAQITSPGSTTAKPLAGKIAQVSTSTIKPTGITEPPTLPAEHSNKIKTNESTKKIGSKSSDQTVTKA